MAEKSTGKEARGLGPIALWGGWAIAAVAWALHLVISYTVVEWYCHSETGIAPGTIYWILNGTTLVTVVLALASAVLGWRNLRRVRPAKARDTERLGRQRFMALTGIMLSLFFLSIILVQGMPNFFLRPCQ